MSVLSGGIAGLLNAMNTLGATMAGNVQAYLQRLQKTIRGEVRHAASAFAFALATAAFAVMAMFFSAVAIMMAAWNTHPVLASALIAAGFALLALVAAVLLRNDSR